MVKPVASALFKAAGHDALLNQLQMERQVLFATKY